jgi:hypothetical protein
MYSTLKIGWLAVAAVLLLALATPTRAAVRPDDRAGVRGVGVAAATAATRPDDRPGIRGSGSGTALGGSHAAPESGTGFDWTSAGAGAGAAGVVVLLLAGALTLRKGLRREEASV